MKKLDQLLLKSYIGPLVLTFFIALFVLDMMFLWKYVDDMIGKGIETFVLMELMFYASATSVPMAFPLAVLVASIMTFGNYGEHFELTAVKSSGVSLFRFMRPLIVFSLIVSGLAFYFSNNVLPIANLKFKSLLHDIRNQKPALNFKEGIFNTDIDGFSIKIDGKSADQKTIYGVVIYDHTSGRGNDHVITADSATLKNSADGNILTLLLYYGKQYKEETLVSDNGAPVKHYRSNFDFWEKKFDLSAFQLDRTDESYFSKIHSMLNIRQLQNGLDTVKMEMDDEILLMNRNLSNYYINKKLSNDTTGLVENLQIIDTSELYQYVVDRTVGQEKTIYNIASTKVRNVKNIINGKVDVLKYKNRDKVQYQVHMHQKFTLSVACILLFFIGAPLGSIIKKGGFGWPMFLATIFFVIYLVTSIIGEKISESTLWQPWQGMWLSTALLTPLGIFLTVKAKNDAQLLSLPNFVSNAFKNSIIPKALAFFQDKFNKDRAKPNNHDK